jgi:hypothetical protein
MMSILAHQPELGRSDCNVDASFYNPAGHTPCNVDASFYKPDGHTGSGWCIRNSQLQFMAAGCNWILLEAYYN